MSKVCLGVEEVKHLLNRAWEAADNMEREGRHQKKAIEEIKQKIFKTKVK